jgi:hypothetical protein
MPKTTYHIIACMEGTLSVVGETLDPNKTIRDIIGRVTNPTQVQMADASQAAPEPEEVPICAIHEVPMVWIDKNGGFWSCHQKNADQSWCSYRPGR